MRLTLVAAGMLLSTTALADTTDQKWQTKVVVETSA